MIESVTNPISSFARRRMRRFGLRSEHVSFALQRSDETYSTHGADVYVTLLPDGRRIKVRVKDNTVVDAFQTAGGKE